MLCAEPVAGPVPAVPSRPPGPRAAGRRPGAAARLAPLLAVLAGGCALDGTIAGHSVAYNHSVERAADALLVHNILRARDRAPLHFTTVASISGNLSTSVGLGYDLTLSGAGVQPAAYGASNPGFTVAPLDRQEFARGMLRPVEPTLFRLLSDRGLPDQLLLYLLVSKFQDGALGPAYVNDPARRHPLDADRRAACRAAGPRAPPPCDPFQTVVDAMTRHGRLIFNGYRQLTPVGPRLDARRAGEADVLAGLRDGGLVLRPDGPGFRLHRASDELVVCVAQPPGPDGAPRYAALALDRDGTPPQAAARGGEGGDPCVADEVVTAPPDPGHPPAGPSWYLRSVDEVLHYLGAVQRREEEGVAYRVRVPDGAGGAVEPRLFRLWETRPDRPRLTVSYRGETRWVAAQDDAHDQTLAVLALTTQLLNLQKSAEEIPASRTLRLVR